MPPYRLAPLDEVTATSLCACAASSKLVSLSSIPDSDFLRLRLTAPLEDCTHGRAATLTSTRLELLLVTVSVVTAPAAAGFSITTGPTFSPPSAAAARGLASSARAITAPPDTAASTTTPANARRPTIDICKDPLFTPTSPSRRKPGRDANVAPGCHRLRRGGAERERQRLRVRACPQRVVGSDRLAHDDRERVVGCRTVPRPRHAQDLQRLRQYVGPIRQIAGIGHRQRRVAGRRRRARRHGRLIHVRDPRYERAEAGRGSDRQAQHRGNRAADRRGMRAHAPVGRLVAPGPRRQLPGSAAVRAHHPDVAVQVVRTARE